MADLTERIRLKAILPSWDDYNISYLTGRGFVSVTSEAGTPVKVFDYNDMLYPFRTTMADIKVLTDNGSIPITNLAIYSHAAAPSRFAVDFTLHPIYESIAFLFICFDYDGVAYALAISIN